MAPGTLCALLLASLTPAVVAMRDETDVAKELCTPEVMLDACKALGVSDIGAHLAPGQVAALLALSADEVQSMLEALGPASQPMTVQTLCHAAVGGIVSVLHETPPKAQGSACIDAACEGPGVDISIEAMLKDPPEVAPHFSDDDEDVVVEDTPGTDGAEGAGGPDTPVSVADSLRLLLHVAFGVFPAPNEAESGDEPGGTHSSGSSLAQVPPTFGDQVRKDRYHEYRRHIQLAAAWAATALRKMEPSKVCKWFGADKTAEVRRVLTRALVALENIHVRKNPEGYCDQNSDVVAFVRSYMHCDAAYASQVMAGAVNKGCGLMENGRYQINFCEHFWGTPPVFRTGTILHEMIHHFGVKDKSYKYGEIRYELSTEANLNNADTYAFFAADVNGQASYRVGGYGGDVECQEKRTRVKEGDKVRSLIAIPSSRPQPVRKGDIGTVTSIGDGSRRGLLHVTFHQRTSAWVGEADLVKVTATVQRGDRVRSLVSHAHWNPAPLRRGQVGIVVDTAPGKYLVDFGHVSGWLRKEDFAEVADIKPGDRVRSLVPGRDWKPKPLRKGDRGTVVSVEPRDGGGDRLLVDFGYTKGWTHLEYVVKDAGDAPGAITTASTPTFKVGDTVRSLVAKAAWTPKPLRAGDVGRVEKVDTDRAQEIGAARGEGAALLVDFGHCKGWLYPESVIEAKVKAAQPEKAGISLRDILSWVTLGFIN